MHQVTPLGRHLASFYASSIACPPKPRAKAEVSLVRHSLVRRRKYRLSAEASCEGGSIKHPASLVRHSLGDGGSIEFATEPRLS